MEERSDSGSESGRSASSMTFALQDLDTGEMAHVYDLAGGGGGGGGAGAGGAGGVGGQGVGVCPPPPPPNTPAARQRWCCLAW